METGDRADPRGGIEEDIVRANVMSRLFSTGGAIPKIGRYRMLEHLGSGAMGMVWAAYDPHLDRRVALKLLHDADEDPSDDERVLAEARTMASINHPNVAHVYEVGSRGGSIFIAMEYVDGPTLRRWRVQSKPGWREVLSMYLQAGRGLAAAHDAGVVHRDFKPDNALVGPDGRVRVVDFGLARASLDMGATDPGDGNTETTSTRRRAGTPAYMAPEQFRGEPADARADQFSFCVALFEALSGIRPFGGNTSWKIYQASQHEAIPVERLPSDVPTWVKRALVVGLQRDPKDRHASMAELIAKLGRDPARTRRRRFATAGVVAVVFAAVAVGRSTASAPAPCPTPTQRLEQAWSDELRATARAAFEGSAANIAVRTWPVVKAELDGYSRAWAEAHRDACEATHVRHEQSESLLDARMRCLDERLRAHAALAQTFAEADAVVVEKAIEAVQALPRIEACADPAYVEATHPPPQDPKQAAAMADELDRIARVRASVATGRFAEAKQLAGEVLENAKEIGDHALVARAMHALGSAEAKLGEVEAARKRLHAAYEAGRLARVDDVAASAAAEIAYLLARHTSDYGEAELWAGIADTEGRLLQNDRLRAAARNAAGVAAARTTRYPEARAAFSDAIALLGDTPSSAAALTYRANLGRLVRFEGDLEGAAEILEEVLRDAERLLGPEHPALVVHIDALAEPWGLLGRRRELAPLLDRALRISIRTRGENHPDTARLFTVIGRNHLRLGRLDEARDALEKAVSASKQAAQRGAEQGIMGRLGLAHVYLALNEPDNAIEQLRLDVAEKDRPAGPRTRDHALSRGELANALVSAQRYEEALAEIEASIETFTEVLGPQHLDLSQAWQVRAEALAGLGREAEAVTDLERAIAIRERVLGPDSHKMADLYGSLAEVHLQQGRPAQALAAAERCRELTGGHQDLLPHELAHVDFVIARALDELGNEPERASTLAESALEALRAGPPAAVAEAADVETWLRARD